MENVVPIALRIPALLESWKEAFCKPDFYLELLSIGVMLALAWLITLLAKKRTAKYLAEHPLKRVNSDFILKPFDLLAPFLAVLFLAIITPFVELYSDGGAIDAVMKLTVAYFVARGVMLIVHSKIVAYFIAFVVLLAGTLRAAGLLRSTIAYLNSIAFEIGHFHISLLNIVHGVVILVVVFWLATASSRTLENYLRHSSSLNYNTRELIAKFFRIFVYFIAFLVTLSAMGVDLTAFAVFGGALGVGIGLGLQKLTSNFVSGITLLVEKSIKMGDLIEVGGQTGRVRQLNIRYALIETSDGRELLIPNEELVSTRVTNWTYSNANARIEVKVSIDYDTDAIKARELMLEAARVNPRCLKYPEPTAQLREFTDHGMLFVVNFWIPDVQDGRFGPQSDVMFSIIDKFRNNGIKIAVAS